MIKIHTDGACRGNQYTTNQGGWGFAITDTTANKIRHAWGHETNTTSNRMVMTAAISALHAIRNRPPSSVTLFSDSQLMIKGMNEWLKGWKARGWKTANRKPVENKDLWLQLENLDAKHKISWVHVKAHSGNFDNEIASQLAKRGADGTNGTQDFKAIYH